MAKLTAHFLVFLIIRNLENNFVVSKVHQLVYIIEILEAYLKIPCFTLMKDVLNATHLA